MERDKFWHQSVPKELPYTIAALPFRHETDMTITERDCETPAPLFHGSRPASSWTHHIPDIRKISSTLSFFRKVSHPASICSDFIKHKQSCQESVVSTDHGGIHLQVPGHDHKHHYSTPDHGHMPVKRLSVCSAVPNFTKHAVISEHDEVSLSKPQV